MAIAGRAMDESAHSSITEMLYGGPVPWEKGGHHFNLMDHIRSCGGEIVYEDDLVIAYVEEDDDQREAAKGADEKRITIAPKGSVQSLFDLDVGDTQTAAHLLYAIQQVTFKLGLHKTGYEIRANVMPPYQQRPRLRLKIRTENANQEDELG